MQVLLIQVDGKLPNLALMKLAHWHRSQGHTVTLTRRRSREIYSTHTTTRSTSPRSSARVKSFSSISKLIGPTPSSVALAPATVKQFESIIGRDYEFYDYHDYPQFQESIGFTKRGCRLNCKFCVVPEKEGKPYPVNSINDIWRGAPYPRKLHLLDNDFFGHESWRSHIREIIDGNFRVCLSQGINVRMITTETAEALASIQQL